MLNFLCTVFIDLVCVWSLLLTCSWTSYFKYIDKVIMVSWILIKGNHNCEDLRDILEKYIQMILFVKTETDP